MRLTHIFNHFNFDIKLQGWIAFPIHTLYIYAHNGRCVGLFRHLGYERVYLPLYKVGDTPFHIRGNDL